MSSGVMAKGIKQQSPDFVKISQASAISLGLARGRMYRGAVNRCVNLLIHYPEGCTANCAYCGLAKKRPGTYQEKSFIRVDWPVLGIDVIVAAINRAPGYVKRICISMITNGKCPGDTIELARRFRNETSLSLSVLISPTVLDEYHLLEMKEIGVDKVGVAIDLATPELFDRYRGNGVSGPHKWDTYWEMSCVANRIFGHLNVGAHLMVGMGETEAEMVSIMDRLWQMGVVSHLFSFFPEEGSGLARRPQPPWPTYLRVQLARYLVEKGLSRYRDMAFDGNGRILDFGLPRARLDPIVSAGIPFMTTGCLGPDGQVACNRPFGNCLPGVRQWNYPYLPNQEEISLIRQDILTFEN